MAEPGGHTSCCNAILAAAPKTTTDRLQRVLNAAVRVVSDTKKFDQGLSRLMHQELHWLDIPVNYLSDFGIYNTSVFLDNENYRLLLIIPCRIEKMP